MNPRLVCLSGSHEGSVFLLTGPLTGEPFSIGRVAANQVAVQERAASRNHCVVERIESSGAARFQVRDLGSHNGTFVNELPVTERLLEHGDRIRVASSTFLFLLHQDEVQPAGVALHDSDWEAGSSVDVRGTEDFIRRPGARTEADLRAILRISGALASVYELESLEQKLLECLAEITPADRGAVILVGSNSGEFTSLFGWDRYPERDRGLEVSRPAIDRALRERKAFLGKQGVVSGAAVSGIASFLVVPLIARNRTIGVVYLDNSDLGAPFLESHLELVAGVGPIAAMALENARRWRSLKEENERLQALSGEGRLLIGESDAMKSVRQFIAKVATSDATVLIGGESGTGKELVARAIHAASARSGGPFLAVNCAALTESLLESEMFGHEKGAFTGAAGLKKGRLELADGGTFFLDEVGELGLTLQAKLLRVLQEREFERVGGTRTIKLDIRLIAATNRGLKDAVRDKAFREDLYYRLNVVSVTLPPLRERRADISLLATYFLAKHGEKSARPLDGLSPEARQCLQAYDWPGNVRELENAIERAVVMRSSDAILPEDLPDSVLESGNAVPHPGKPELTYHGAVLETKKRIILEALAASNGNYTLAAKALGVHVNYLHRLIRNMNLRS